MSRANLPSTYLQYKEDTHAFTEWLGRISKACGYVLTSVPEPEPSSSTNTSTTVRYAVSTKDILAQVNLIVEHKDQICFPNRVSTHLKRAIDVRKRCSSWYKNTRINAAGYDVDGHKYFVDLLEDAFIRLSVHKGTPEVSNKLVTKELVVDSETIDAVNRFSLLEIEEVDSEPECIKPTEIKPNTTPEMRQAERDVYDEYELQEEKTDDDAFAVFCLFEEIQRVRENLQQTWRGYDSEKFDLLTATVITQVSILIIDRAERELYSKLFPDKPVENSYEALVGMTVAGESSTKGKGTEQARGADARFGDESIFLPTAHTLKKFINAFQDPSSEWPLMIAPLKSNHLDKEERTRAESDDETLSQLLLDSILPDCIEIPAKKTADQFILAPQRDTFQKMLRPVWKVCDLSVTTVAASRIWLDVVENCKDLPKHSQQLAYALKYASKFSGRNKLIIQTTMIKEVSQINKTLRQWCEPMMPRMKRAMLVHFMPPEETKAERIRPAEDTEFVFRKSPTLMGSNLLRILVEYQAVGLSTASSTMYVLVVAHLYNALRQLKMFDREWIQMDRVIELHKGTLFAGVIPTEVDEIADRISLRLNISDKYAQQRWLKDEKWMLREPASTRILRILLDNQLSTDEVLWQTEQSLNSKPPPNSNTSSSGPHRNNRKMTPEVLIGELQDAIPRALDDASIDYIRLSEECTKIAKQVAKHVPKEWNMDESDKFITIEACAQALKDAKRFRDSGWYSYRAGDGGRKEIKGSNSDPNDPIRHGRGMLAASKAFYSCLSEKNIDFKFPLASASEGLSISSWSGDQEVITAIVGHCGIRSVADLSDLLENNKYAVISFYKREKDTIEKNWDLRDMVYHHNMPFFLAFAEVSTRSMRNVSKKYCEGKENQHTIAFFRNGKPYAVKGKKTIPGSDVAGLKVAIEELEAEVLK